MIDKWLKAGVLEDGLLRHATEGSPQGGVISPILSNIFLHHVLDEWFESEVRPRLAGNSALVRFADDAVMAFAYFRDAKRVLRVLGKRLHRYGLTLHPEKTHVGDCRQPGQGFEFLGYRFEAGQRHVRKKSLNTLKDAIRAKTKRTRGDSLARIVLDLNRTLRGWFGYFKHAL